jgi:hypothetical protein
VLPPKIDARHLHGGEPTAANPRFPVLDHRQHVKAVAPLIGHHQEELRSQLQTDIPQEPVQLVSPPLSTGITQHTKTHGGPYGGDNRPKAPNRHGKDDGENGNLGLPRLHTNLPSPSPAVEELGPPILPFAQPLHTDDWYPKPDFQAKPPGGPFDRSHTQTRLPLAGGATSVTQPHQYRFELLPVQQNGAPIEPLRLNWDLPWSFQQISTNAQRPAPESVHRLIYLLERSKETLEPFKQRDLWHLTLVFQTCWALSKGERVSAIYLKFGQTVSREMQFFVAK